MEIKRTSEIGFCYGVRRALKIVERALGEGKKVATLGPVVHNNKVVGELLGRGVEIISDPEEVEGRAVVITAHGSPPFTLEELARRGIEIIDATCPVVRRAQIIARNLAEEGFEVLIFGEEDHTEVRGLMGWARGRGLAALSIPPPERLGRKIGVIAQTTQDPDKFAQFAADLCRLFLPDKLHIRICNTICPEVTRRLREAEKIAREVEMMLVVGGKISANTRRLASLCSRYVETFHIEGAWEIPEKAFGCRAIGLTSGTSTPAELVEEVERRLREEGRS